MKPAPFEYHAPTSIDAAAALLDELGDAAKPLAGGQSLVPLLAMRLTAYDHLVDLNRIESLRGVRRSDDGASLWIGAATTQSEIEQSQLVADTVPLLSLAAPLIGHFPIRNRGTVGGSIAHADAAAELPAVALTLGARMNVRSSRGERTVASNDFFAGMWTTALADDELLTSVEFPVWTGHCGFAIEEFARRHGDFAIAGAAVAVEVEDPSGGKLQVRRCRIGLIGLGSTPLRASDAEASVIGATLDDVDVVALANSALANLDSVPSDLHGSSAYRVRVGAEMVARAWRSATERARRAALGVAAS